MRMEFEINNLNEYINVLREIQSTNRSGNTTLNLYYRGQDKRYIDENKDSIVASAYRRDDLLRATKRNYREDKLSAYYRMIANQLSSLEAENFIAYAQHHGLHTQLLDVTEDPLVALFFAIENGNEFDEDGVIYVFKQGNTVDISKEMKGHIEGFNIFLILLIDKPENLLKTFNYYRELESYSDNFYIYFVDLLNTIKCNVLFNNDHENSKIICILQEYLKEREISTESVDELLIFLKENEEIKEIFYKFYNNLKRIPIYEELDINRLLNLHIQGAPVLYPWYVLILKSLISINRSHFTYPSEEYFIMPQLPNFLYKPSIIFDRMLDQSGSFLVQSIYRSHVKDTVEEIDPDFIINVKNKEQLVEELKLLGLKRTKYFNDPDNIAMYLNENNW